MIHVFINEGSKIDIKTLKFGYLKSAFEADYKNKDNDKAALKKIKNLGADLIPVELPDIPIYSLSLS